MGGFWGWWDHDKPPRAELTEWDCRLGLPAEVFEMVLAYLSVVELVTQAGMVNSAWRDAITRVARRTIDGRMYRCALYMPPKFTLAERVWVVLGWGDFPTIKRPEERMLDFYRGGKPSQMRLWGGCPEMAKLGAHVKTLEIGHSVLNAPKYAHCFPRVETVIVRHTRDTRLLSMLSTVHTVKISGPHITKNTQLPPNTRTLHIDAATRSMTLLAGTNITRLVIEGAGWVPPQSTKSPASEMGDGKMHRVLSRCPNLIHLEIKGTLCKNKTVQNVAGLCPHVRTLLLDCARVTPTVQSMKHWSAIPNLKRFKAGAHAPSQAKRRQILKAFPTARMGSKFVWTIY